MDHHQAVDAIEQDLRAGAVDTYLSGDDALEILGDLFLLHFQRAEPGEGLAEHLRRNAAAVGNYLDTKFGKIVADNVAFVMEEAAKAKQHARSDYRELTTERVAA